MDDARARSTRAAVIHSSDRAVGRAVRARAFSVSMREGGCVSSRHRSMECDAGGRAHAPISVARDCHHQWGGENVVTTTHTYSLQTR